MANEHDVGPEADQFEVAVVWKADEPMVPGRRYELVAAGVVVGARVASPQYRLDEQRRQLAAVTLVLGDHGVAILTTEQPIAVGEGSGETLQLLDPASGAVLAELSVRAVLRNSTNLHWQEVAIDKAARRRLSGHRAGVVWFTGLSGSGKSAIANEVEHQLHTIGVRTYLLDGDNVRQGLNRDLGFTEPDRIENIRRIGEVAKLMVDAGLVVLTAFISPFRDERWWVRDLFEPGEFCEVFVDTPLDVAEQRDVKGLYAKARRGELRNFTGIDSRYEPPLQPEVHLNTTQLPIAASADRVIQRLRELGTLPPTLPPTEAD